MKTSLGVSLASLVIVQLAGFQSIAIAQDAILLEEIVVTSQRREQSLQEVPISITAFTGDVLQQMNITEAQQYIALTPNVSYTDGFSVGKRGFGIGIRGVNNMVTDENTFVNSVGVYLDEFSVAAVPTGVVNGTSSKNGGTSRSRCANVPSASSIWKVPAAFPVTVSVATTRLPPAFEDVTET